jgi:hypothetical protein
MSHSVVEMKRKFRFTFRTTDPRLDSFVGCTPIMDYKDAEFVFHAHLKRAHIDLVGLPVSNTSLNCGSNDLFEYYPDEGGCD